VAAQPVSHHDHDANPKQYHVSFETKDGQFVFLPYNTPRRFGFIGAGWPRATFTDFDDLGPELVE